MYLFEVPLALLVVLISLKQKRMRMRRLVSVCVFYILGKGYIAYGITQNC